MAIEPAQHRLIEALGGIELAAAANVERGLEIQRRVRWFRERLEAGETVEALVDREPSPGTVELITMNKAALEDVGSEFRAALALALREGGLTIDAIASHFGVTRQRISALLRQKAAQPPQRD